MYGFLRKQTRNKVWVHNYLMDFEVHEAQKNKIKLRIPDFKDNVKHQKQQRKIRNNNHKFAEKCKVNYLNRENFKLLDKLLYISRKEGKLSRGALKNTKYRHVTLNTQYRRRWHEQVIRENISLQRRLAQTKSSIPAFQGEYKPKKRKKKQRSKSKPSHPFRQTFTSMKSVIKSCRRRPKRKFKRLDSRQSRAQSKYVGPDEKSLQGSNQ